MPMSDPAGRIVRATGNDDVIDQPACPIPTPGPDIDLDAVLLHIDTGGQEQTTNRDLNPAIGFTAFRQPLPFRRIARLDPCLA